MNILQSGSTTELAHFHEAQATYRNKKQKSTTIEIFQSCVANTVLYGGFFAMTSLSTTQNGHSRVRNFTVLVTYMMRLQSPLKSLSPSVRRILDRAVNFERLYTWLRI